MQYLDEFLALSVIHICAMMLPGPDFALVLQQSVAHGKRFGLWASVGIACGLSIHILYTLLGVGILITQTPIVFGAVELLGALYLAYIAYTLLKPNKPHFVTDITQPANEPTTQRQAFVKGFFCNIFNPKVTLFFLAVFTSIVDHKTPFVVQAIYGAWMIITALMWFFFVSFLFSRESVRAKFFKAGPWFERITGLIILGFSINLAQSATTIFF